MSLIPGTQWTFFSALVGFTLFAQGEYHEGWAVIGFHSAGFAIFLFGCYLDQIVINKMKKEDRENRS